MPSATPPSPTEDEIDDLLYFARAGETQDLGTTLRDLAQTKYRCSEYDLLAAAVDPESGNGILHMTAANGHVAILQQLLSLSSASALSPTILSAPNRAGNTPLHYASLNGHLPMVKMLVDAGADPTVRNGAGHDVVFEAEGAGREGVVAWLLSEGGGEDDEDERGGDEGNGEGLRQEEEEEEEEGQEGKEGMGEVERGVEGMNVDGSGGCDG
ncbi:MAG: hypothetical protein M1827_000118 [Pycnora praestabilis]|nr:MAG: hypothetical protein M1827_000118 [Pycnora praestabilis]